MPKVPTKPSGVSQKGTISYHLKVAIVYAALTEVLDSTEECISIDAGQLAPKLTESSEKEEDRTLCKICTCAAKYLNLQHYIFRSVPAAHDVTESDFEAVFGDDYGKVETHVDIIEGRLRFLANSIELKTDIWARFKYNRSSFIKSYSDVVGAKNKLSLLEQDKLESEKIVKKTQTVLETFRNNIKKAKWNGIKYLRRNVAWRMDEDGAKSELKILMYHVDELCTFVNNRQVLDWPDQGRNTSLSFWEMELARPTRIPQQESIAACVSELEGLSIPLQRLNEYVEARSSGNGTQTRVERESIGPNGKYRGVCKLKLWCQTTKFPGGRILFEGSGWLYDKRTVVTAGHCLYDVKWSHDEVENLGPTQVTDIDVCLGLSDNSGTNTYEERRAKWVLIPRTWRFQRERKNDIGVIRLEKAFDSWKSFRIGNPTTKKGHHSIYVLGYPLDRPKYDNDHSGPEGNTMYESSWAVDFSRRALTLRYRADTSGGNSGGPVLCRGSGHSGALEAVGVHVGSVDGRTNEAVLLREYGNDVPAFARALQRIERESRALQQQQVHKSNNTDTQKHENAAEQAFAVKTTTLPY